MSSSEIKKKAKEFAGNLFTKLLEKKDNEDQPTGTQDAAHGLVHSFNSLSVQPPLPPPPAGGNFVGGFHPGYAMPPNTSMPSLHHASSAPPPFMPSPAIPPPPHQQSVTMQMALKPDPTPALPRPSSAPSVPFTQNQLQEVRPIYTPPKPKPSSSKHQRPATPDSDDSFTPSIEIVDGPTKKPAKSKPAKGTGSKPGTPSKTPKRPSAPPKSSNDSESSTVSTPGGKEPKEGQVQCSGTTKAGKRCTRVVKTAPALSQQISEDGDDNDDSDSAKLERFCFQHTKELLTTTGCYARKNGEWVEFSDWIPSYLQSDTQLLLRIEMEKARSMSDQDGYIYTFEIREDDDEVVKLKVGRAVNLAKRIDEWSKQCGSKQQVLRGFYPNPEEDVDAPTTLMKGRVKAGEKSACCHRLERLIHLELADLAATQIYLEPKWPSIVLDQNSPPIATKTEKRTPCPDCGSRHKEIFEFQRWTKGSNKNKEWEKIVKPVIERWGKFIELYV